MKNDTKVMIGTLCTFLFMGWILLNAPNVIQYEESYIPVSNTTVIADPVWVEVDDLTFEDAFELNRIAKGPYMLFWWQGNEYHTCHEEEVKAHPDKCLGDNVYSIIK